MSADVVFFLTLVAPPIKGGSRVRKIKKTKFLKNDTWWSIDALNWTIFSSPYSFQAAQRTAAQKEKEAIKAAKKPGMGGIAGTVIFCMECIQDSNFKSHIQIKLSFLSLVNWNQMCSSTYCVRHFWHIYIPISTFKYVCLSVTKFHQSWHVNYKVVPTCLSGNKNHISVW